MWHSLPDLFPDDAATVWVRRYYFSNPFLATFSVANQEFTSATGYTLPWWAISRWREQ